MSYMTSGHNADLTSTAGVGVGGEDMIQVQTTHHPNNIATTEISMYQCYMPSNHATNAHQHQVTTSSSASMIPSASAAPFQHSNNAMLHNGLTMAEMDNAMMRHQQQIGHHELPPHQNHRLQEQQQYYLTDDEDNLSNSLQQRLYNHAQHGMTSGHALAQLPSEQRSEQGSSAWYGGGGSALSQPDPQYMHHHQSFTASHAAHNGGSHSYSEQISSSSTASAPVAPPPPQINQYPHQRTQPAGAYSSTAPSAPPTASITGTAASLFDTNFKFGTDHFAALNLHAPYSESAAGGLFGGLLMGGGGNSAGGNVGQVGPPIVGAEDEVRQQSVSSDSQAFYGNETMVKELRPEFVRWFYRYEQDRKWKPFTGYDSIRIESKYREVFRGQIVSYSHNTYYPVAASNDESTDFSKFVQMTHTQQQHQQQQQMMGFPPGAGLSVNNNNNGTSVSNQATPSRFSDMMQHKWWPGKGSETTVDTEFNNGGIGFPPSIRNNSVGGSPSSYLPSAIKGRMGPTNKDKMLQKANSASALLGNNGAGGVAGTPNYGGNGTFPMGPPPNLDLNKVIIVREGLYEVDLESWTCFSTYWPGDTCIITRGTWFYDGTWDPLPVEQAEKLEEGHMGKFCGASLINIQNVAGQTEEEKKGAAGASAAPAIHRVSFNDFHVDWTSPTDIHWYSTAASHKFMRSVGQKLGFSDWGHRICRGYYKPASIVDRPSEISHIVFVIHGIGHKMDTGRIVRNCSAFRDCVATMKEKYFPQLTNAKQRAEFFPVEWRSAAKLDGDIVEAITPQKLVTLRQLLNSTAMDIMYYTSPLYRAEIQNALRDELNRIYANFVKRNPHFTRNGGRVSVMAHSLGAIITYDIMTGYLSSVEDDIGMQHHIPSLCPQQGLLFNLEHFFCLGSPLSVFLALRWREPHDPTLRSRILPRHLCKRVYNVFYSSDPVAYRLEPLLNRHFVRIAPVTIHSYNAPNKLRYADMPRELITKEMTVTKTASDNTNASSLPVPSFGASSTSQKTTPTNNAAVAAAANFIPSSLKSPPQLQTPNNDASWGNFFNIKKYWKGSTSPAAPDGVFTGAPEGHVGELPGGPMEDPNYTQAKDNYSTVIDEEPLNNIPNDLEYRLDYVLRESQFSGSSYIAALTSHTSYWNSPDAAYFVMTHLYDDLIEQTSEER